MNLNAPKTPNKKNLKTRNNNNNSNNLFAPKKNEGGYCTGLKKCVSSRAECHDNSTIIKNGTCNARNRNLRVRSSPENRKTTLNKANGLLRNFGVEPRMRVRSSPENRKTTLNKANSLLRNFGVEPRMRVRSSPENRKKTLNKANGLLRNLGVEPRMRKNSSGVNVQKKENKKVQKTQYNKNINALKLIVSQKSFKRPGFMLENNIKEILGQSNRKLHPIRARKLAKRLSKK